MSAAAVKTRLLPRWMISEHPFPWLLPASALMVIFGLYPLLYAVWLSLQRKHPVTRKLTFAPTYNWSKLLGDERVWNALGNTLVYTGVALVLQLVLGMLIALLLDSDRKGYGLLRAMMTLPLVIPPAVTAMMFLLMLNGSFGVLARGIIATGLLPPGFSILGTASTAMAGVLLAEVWQWTPFVFLIVLAGMYAVPRSLYEAAELDGTSLMRQIFLITVPLLKRVLVIVLLLRLIDLLRAFEIIVATTQGGPGDASYTLPVLTWESAFVNFQMGDAAATSLVLLGVVTIVITLLIRAISRQGAVGMERR